MPTYAIGDVQGCHTRLTELLERLHAEPGEAHFIFLGDLVNRGPQSLQTLRTIRALGATAQMVLGNHDLHLLAAAHTIRTPRAGDTLGEVLEAPDHDELLDWLRTQPLALMQDGHLLVHAGVLPQWTPTRTLELAGEVEAVLQSTAWVDFLRNMYGNEPAQWDDALSGFERLRCIVNALTRIRFCTPEGRMDFASKESAGSTPPGHVPWFDAPARKTAATCVVFGHWSTLGLTVRPDLVCVDTGCVWGGKLSAVRLEDHAVFQVDCPQVQRPG
jgi:bis(5'-nucleosyl)-tetraphosphatase (symmetrical)